MSEKKSIKRIKSYTPEQQSFVHLDPSKSFPEGSFERFLVEMISKIDINCFLETDQKDVGGKTQYNPRGILAVIFYGICAGMYSARKMADSCIHDIRYIYVSGGITPEHSTISRFINKHFTSVRQVFTQILYIAAKKRYVDYKMIATDGTKIRANAGEKFNGKLSDFRKKQKRLETNIEKALERIKNAESTEEQDYWDKKVKRYQKDAEKIEQFLETAQELKTKSGDEVIQNITDPDSRVMKNKGSFQSSYNSQISVCEKNGLIVSHEVVNKANDKDCFVLMVEKTQEYAGEKNRETVQNAVYLNDTGYHSASNAGYSKEHQINVYMPDNGDKNIYDDKTSTPKKLYNLVKENDQLQVYCLNGHKLFMKTKRIKDQLSFLIYKRDELQHCKSCPHFNICQKKEEYNREFWISEDLYNNYDAVKEIEERLRTEKGKRLYSRRMPAIEKVFGCIKKNFKINSYLVKSIEKVRTHWAIICISYNMLRMFKLTNQN